MTRMIERWFPCAEVSDASTAGWGSGNNEANLFTWFAKRPLVQAKAAVLTSLLPWPDDEHEQRRLQDLVRRALQGRDTAWGEVVAEIEAHYGSSPSTLDPFSGRAMIPLEAARLNAMAYGIDYSPVATMAGRLLADYPMRDWSDEPPLPFGKSDGYGEMRLLDDVTAVLSEVGRRHTEDVSQFYPAEQGQVPWGYLWAITLPCQECGGRFPLIGSLSLRGPQPKKGDAGESFRFVVNKSRRTFEVQVVEGMPDTQPTLVSAVKGGRTIPGKSAVCLFCEHVHPVAVHRRMMNERLGEDVLLLVGEMANGTGKKVFRVPTSDDHAAIKKASQALANEPDFPGHIPAVPDERIPVGNTSVIQPSAYGYDSYGDLCNERQTLSLTRLARVIADLGTELHEEVGLSEDYAAALVGYAASVFVRKLRRSTRGARLQVYRDGRASGVEHIFTNEASIAFSYEYFETGPYEGPGTWDSVTERTIASLTTQVGRAGGRPGVIERGTAIALPLASASIDAVITDPPYDEMIPYSDASDLFYIWLKRVLSTTQPWFSFTADPDGVQEKTDEAIVKKFRARKTASDHRTRDFYDSMIGRAFAEANRVVKKDGVVTIVFGHGDPEVWHRLLGAIAAGGLVLTGSWPAKTESGGSAGSANIVTTLTMSCRPAPSNRPVGRANLVESQVRAEVRSRVPSWEAAGLAPTDQLMASAGPAMEVVGQYEKVLDNLGDPVQADRYLIIARRAVEEAAAIEIDHLPLETFDARTRFALSWTRLYGRSVAPKSEARWQALAADLDFDSLSGLLEDSGKGVRLSRASEFTGEPNEAASVIDVALSMAAAWPNGLDAVAEALALSGRSLDDPYLWAAMSFLSSRLPEGDPDANAWTGLVRNKRGIGAVTREVVSTRKHADEQDQAWTLFDDGRDGESE